MGQQLCPPIDRFYGLGLADAPHQVIPNATTRHWLGHDPRGPGWIRLVNRLASAALRLVWADERRP